MGQAQSTELATSVPFYPAASKDESPVYVNSNRIKENGGFPITHFRSCPEANTPTEVLESVVCKYGDKEFLGERAVNPDGSYGAYQWITYNQFIKMVKSYAAGLKALGVEKGDRVGIYSHSCTNWQLTAFAAYYLGAAVVPIYDSLGADAAKYIVEHSGCKVIFAHQTKKEQALHLQKTTDCKILVIASNDKSSEYKTLNEVIEIGEGFTDFEVTKPDPEDVAMIMYTSGSTGNPKGCVLTHKNLLTGASGLGATGSSITTTDTFYSFLPLAHIYEYGVELIMMAQGVRIGYYTGSVRTLTDDMQTLQPTVITAVPRVFNRIYDTMNDKIEKLSPILRRVIKWSINFKSNALRNDQPQSLLLDILLFGSFREALGGKLRLVISGGAPILPDVYNFFRATVSPNVIQGYGLTEIAVGGSVQEVGSKNPGTIGPISHATDLKLVKVDGLDYDPQAVPPCGEIYLRGDSIFKGYYKNEELTKEVYQDGWFKTGDIGTITSDGQLMIIDRAKQLVKLSQGEYLSITGLTDQYGTAKGVQNIYIYADSHHNAPVALVVPTKELIRSWTERNITDIKNSEVAKEELMKNLKDAFEENKMRGFERIQAIAIELDEFTIENGLLTPSMKPQWHALRNKYESTLVQLYGKN